ncbi:MAG: hypothetical protein JWM88_2344 [Verrucomicrobia bacterium]|nr:hypothetical protein [Verrucomicrobiota bacterium]
MKLPAVLFSLLQDEAYALLCRESLTGALAKLGQQPGPDTPPPANAFRSAPESGQNLRRRLEQLGPIDFWLKGAVEKALLEYLADTNSEFRCCQDAAEVVRHWEIAAESLHDLALAVAGNARALTEASIPPAVPQESRAPAAGATRNRAEALEKLRASVTALQAGCAGLERIRVQFAQLCAAGADALQLPALPDFRDAAWVNRVAALPAGQASIEIAQCEIETRTFCADGFHRLLAEAKEVREACLEAGQAILDKSRRSLRQHARAHFVRERDLDEVIAELEQHRIAAERGAAGAAPELASPAPAH